MLGDGAKSELGKGQGGMYIKTIKIRPTVLVPPVMN